MKNKKRKKDDIFLYNINTLNGLNKKCNLLLTFFLIIINCILSLYEDEINNELIYNFFTIVLSAELGLNIYDVVNEINANTKLQRLQNSLKKRKIDINFFEEDTYKEETIKYIDDEYIYKDNINITDDVLKIMLSKRKYEKYKKSKQNK